VISRSKTLIGAIMLVLVLWTGGLAHAAERIEAAPMASQVLGHFEGDRDEVPSDGHQGVAHHHVPCGEHHVATPTDVPCLSSSEPREGLRLLLSESWTRGSVPDSELRPPIA
jgi:hypothetical protein